MKHTVHVTVTMSVEIDETELKKEFGKVTKKMILEVAKSSASLDNVFDNKVEIVDSYTDTPKYRKGIGSY